MEWDDSGCWEDHTLATPFERYVNELESRFKIWREDPLVPQECGIEYLGMQRLVYSPPLRHDPECLQSIYLLQRRASPRDLVGDAGFLVLAVDPSSAAAGIFKMLLSGMHLAAKNLGWATPLFLCCGDSVVEGIDGGTYWSSRREEIPGPVVDGLARFVSAQISGFRSLRLAVSAVYVYRMTKNIERPEHHAPAQISVDEEYSRAVSRLAGWIVGEAAWLYNPDARLEMELNLRLAVAAYPYTPDSDLSRLLAPVDLVLRTCYHSDSMYGLGVFGRAFHRAFTHEDQTLLRDCTADDAFPMLDHHGYLLSSAAVRVDLDSMLLYLAYCYCADLEHNPDGEAPLVPLVCTVWLAFVRLLRVAWSDRLSDGAARPEAVDPKAPLIDQKLAMLGQCIRMSRKHYSHGERAILNDCERLLDHPDEYLYIPVTQEYPILTRDRIEAWADPNPGEEQLSSDIQAFKAANPRAAFEDFVRWYSPKDWEGSLSRRMAETRDSSNQWRRLWDTLQPCPASEQTPLFDYGAEAERILHELEYDLAMWHVSELLPRVFNVVYRQLDRYVGLDCITRRSRVLAGQIKQLGNMLEIFPWRLEGIVLDDLFGSVDGIEQSITTLSRLSLVLPGLPVDLLDHLVETGFLRLEWGSEEAGHVVDLFQWGGCWRMPRGEKYQVAARPVGSNGPSHECIYVVEDGELQLFISKSSEGD